jgi:predicted nuclease of predicted toxin-antitoxin system
MRIKLDENLPAGLAHALGALGHDVETVPGERLRGVPDSEVWSAAQREGRFLVTQDLDFSDARRFVPGTHAGLLLLRLSEPNRRVLESYVTGLFRDELVDTWTGCVVVATDAKVRVRRPGGGG